MVLLRPGEQLLPGQSLTAHGYRLINQLDGNVVLYDRLGVPVWATDTFHAPGRLEMQADGNLVLYDADGVPRWATSTFEAGALLELTPTRFGVVAPVALWHVALVDDPGPTPEPGPSVVRLIEGEARAVGRSFGDATGARRLHGCSDFCALAKFNEDRDTYLRNLDVTARWQQYTRLGFRCNGWVFTPRGLDIDPIRHGWFESALRGVLDAHRDRGLKVSLSSFDMNGWTDQQAMDTFRRVAQIVSEFGDTVWLSAVTNEMEGTWEPGEVAENIARGHELMAAYRAIYPRGLHAISDPRDRDKAGMQRLAVTAALIHQFGTPIDVGMRRTFNDINENNPDVPVVADEPRGPNGPGGGDVTNPVESPDELFGLYTMQQIVGEASTYFNNPGAASRLPLDSTWGFKELPRLWRDLEIPEDFGQGQLCAGQHNTLLEVTDSHASRADGMRLGDYGLGGISGQWDGRPWAVRVAYDATWSTWYADGKAWEGRLSRGQVIPTPRGFTPAIVRAIT